MSNNKQKRQYAESACLSWKGDPKVGIPSGYYQVQYLYEEIADKAHIEFVRKTLENAFAQIADEPVKCIFDFEYEEMEESMEELEEEIIEEISAPIKK